MVSFLCGNNLFSQERKPDSFFRSADSGMFILKETKDTNQINVFLASAWNKYNQAFYGSGNFEETISYARQGLLLAKKINYKRGVGNASFVLGMCSAAKGNYNESRQYHYAALKTALEEGDKVQIFKGYHNIGIACNNLGIYNVALENHFAALNIIRKVSAIEFYPMSYAGIGNVYLNMENFPEADKYLEDAYNFAAKKQVKPLMGEILLYQGNSFLAQTKFDAAISRYTSALKFLNEQNSNRFLAEVYYGMANVFLERAYLGKDSINIRRDFLTSITWLHKTLMIDREIGIRSMRGYSELIAAYTGIGDYKNALTYYELYSLNGDSSYSKSPYLKISQLKIKYETEKAAAELKAQQEKEKIKAEVAQVKMLAEQKLEQEIALATEKNKYEKSIAEEKIRQEKIRTEKQQMSNLLLMGLILVIVTFVFIILYLKQRSQKKRAIEKGQAIYKMAELEMQSLRSQLNPHFMFNSLNSIQTLILQNETDKSHSYLSRFARLLRMLLENADSPFIPLRKEIDFLELYLALEHLRVPDMQYAISTDPALNSEQTFIPNMLLQPYVENAIWHGLSYKETDKKLQIRIFRENGAVNYQIEDNGVGRKKAEEFKSSFRKQHQSKGMELLNKRIKLLNNQYAAAIQTEITDVMNDNKVSGTLVSIKIAINFVGPLQK